jgi:hypothetical protein
MASLSVPEASDAINRGDYLDDFLVRQAVGTAAGPELLLDPARQRGREGAAARRYVARMAGRATPFGLMAGASPVPVGHVTSLRCEGRTSYKVNVSIDARVLESLILSSVRSADPAALPMRPNPTLWGAAPSKPVVICSTDCNGVPGGESGDAPLDILLVDPVPFEYSIMRLSCAFTCNLDAVMVGRVVVDADYSSALVRRHFDTRGG